MTQIVILTKQMTSDTCNRECASYVDYIQLVVIIMWGLCRYVKIIRAHRSLSLLVGVGGDK